MDQSCDVLDADRILLAPLEPFPVDLNTPKEQWGFITTTGASLYAPTRIYLTDNPSLGLPRQIIDLAGKFTLPRKELVEFAKQGKRVATVGQTGIVYLQHRLAVAFSRVSRDDAEWLSRADLDLKIQYLRDEIKKKKDRLQSKEHAHSKAKTEEERENLLDEIGETKDTLERLETELGFATSGHDDAEPANLGRAEPG